MKKKSYILSIATIFIGIVFLSINKNSKSKDEPILAYLDSIGTRIDIENPFLKIYNFDSTYYKAILNIDTIDWRIIGNFIDSTHIHALISNQNDSTINFYLYQNKSWNKIGADKIDIESIYNIEFIDMDGDNRNEIIVYPIPNMNGNMWPSVYYCSYEDDSIKYAGGFETEFEIKKEQKRLETEYGGSWWMPNMKTIYMWRNEKLVPIKRVEISLKVADMIHDDMTFSYYENPTYDQDTLKLIFETDYKNEYIEMYETFFENN